MNKLIAIMNVVAWSGFWAFGYIALTGAGEMSNSRILIAAILAGLGFLMGMFTYIKLSNEISPRKPVARGED